MAVRRLTQKEAESVALGALQLAYKALEQGMSLHGRITANGPTIGETITNGIDALKTHTLNVGG